MCGEGQACYLPETLVSQRHSLSPGALIWVALGIGMVKCWRKLRKEMFHSEKSECGMNL